MYNACVKLVYEIYFLICSSKYSAEKVKVYEH